jgi:hypothetical protein
MSEPTVALLHKPFSPAALDRKLREMIANGGETARP